MNLGVQIILVVVWLVLLFLSIQAQVRMFWRIRTRVGITETAEKLNQIEEGAILVVRAAQVRFIYRVSQTVYAILVGLIGGLLIFFPEPHIQALNSFLLLVFLYGTQLVTWQLTELDLRTDDKIRDLARRQKNA